MCEIWSLVEQMMLDYPIEAVLRLCEARFAIFEQNEMRSCQKNRFGLVEKQSEAG